MEFIKAEEFLKQPVEVQKVFVEWWKCDNGDLYVDNREYAADKIYFDINCVNMNLEGDIEGDWEYFKTTSTPIFSEGQLRQFIEDKTGKITFSSMTWGGDRFIEIENEEYHSYRREKIMDNDLLQAYWKYACRLAKED